MALPQCLRAACPPLPNHGPHPTNYTYDNLAISVADGERPPRPARQLSWVGLLPFGPGRHRNSPNGQWPNYQYDNAGNLTTVNQALGPHRDIHSRCRRQGVDPHTSATGLGYGNNSYDLATATPAFMGYVDDVQHDAAQSPHRLNDTAAPRPPTCCVYHGHRCERRGTRRPRASWLEIGAQHQQPEPRGQHPDRQQRGALQPTPMMPNGRPEQRHPDAGGHRKHQHSHADALRRIRGCRMPTMPSAGTHLHRPQRRHSSLGRSKA
ncbi:hypothetical protein FQR65_LT20236 [Abscondita terminalis]|nr:hypothetical protein FQR65_LT20236 [Abscondita terminalis]